MAAAPKPPPPPPPLLVFKGTVVGVNVANTPTGHPDVDVVVRGPSSIVAEGSKLCWRTPATQAPRVGTEVTVTVEAI